MHAAHAVVAAAADIGIGQAGQPGVADAVAAAGAHMAVDVAAVHAASGAQVQVMSQSGTGQVLAAGPAKLLHLICAAAWAAEPVTMMWSIQLTV